MTACTLAQHIRRATVVCAAVAVSAVTTSAALAEDVLRSLTAFPSTDNTSQLYVRFADAVNERGKGIVRVDVIGGPEIVPGLQQIEAVGRGVVDMTFGPISYALGSMPEADAWVGSDLDPMVTRENGGFALVQQVAAETLGIHILARFAPAAPLHLYLLEEPARKEDGSIDLTGKRLRASPLYNAFYESLGAIPVSIPVPDVYTGLERGTFDGLGYPPSAIEGWNWDRFLKYRVDPGFLQADLGIYIAPAKWATLSEESRQILTEVAIEFEASSYEDWQKLTGDVNARFEAQGMQVVQLEGDAAKAFVDAAHDAVWNRLKASGSPHADALRALYFSR
ncbi:TRAP transporter substrate-binding protein DctP [Pseudotabrizicola alkalilacus]|uniref:C4-dicarboxylate ABC transporter substrate-binding protein n=1 Tax=Pseudotabrizicola alkalilacus TaxID=2305252 RepID=A0A411Z320_9RHOB|nr:TRAP transporter substrate-binding protein DctP [Pseudotabrizicola alkalilacus]RGP37430.1 C4-dicarboxylate ABC transporter substrate-binding protein [Pseudotabrizicola alkalilacus]